MTELFAHRQKIKAEIETSIVHLQASTLDSVNIREAISKCLKSCESVKSEYATTFRLQCVNFQINLSKAEKITTKKTLALALMEVNNAFLIAVRRFLASEFATLS